MGQEISMARLPEARNPSFVGFTHDMFLEASPTPCPHLHPEGEVPDVTLLWCSSYLKASGLIGATSSIAQNC